MKWKRFRRVVVVGAIGGGVAFEMLHGEEEPHVHSHRFEQIEVIIKAENRGSTGTDLWLYSPLTVATK